MAGVRQVPFYKWCRRRDLNPHGLLPLPPQDSVSTNSTTSASKITLTFNPTWLIFQYLPKLLSYLVVGLSI